MIGLQATLANIRDDTGPNGKREHFEADAAYILPKDPVMKRRENASEKKPAADIASTNVKADIG